MSCFRLLSFKTGLVAVVGLLLASSAVQAAPAIVRFGGVRYGGVGVGRYGGIGYLRPAYYGGFGRGYGYGGYGLGYGLGGFGLGLGTGLGLGYGLGSGLGGYGLGYGGYGYGVPALGYGGYSSGYPASNYGYGVPAYGPANPYAAVRPPANLGANSPLPQQQALQQQPQEERLPPVQAKENRAHVTVVVPEGAELWFNGVKASQSGPQRKFITPALTPGEDFTYTLKARWMENGKPVEQTRSINVQANSSQVIDFTK